MLLELYMFLWITACVLAILSFYFKAKKFEGIILPFLAAAFFLFAAINSGGVDMVKCESNTANYVNSTVPANLEIKWSCFNYAKIETGMDYLGYGLGIIMFIYAIITALEKSAQSMIEASQGDED